MPNQKNYKGIRTNTAITLPDGSIWNGDINIGNYNIVSGSKTVATAGTAEQLTSSQDVFAVIITPLIGNEGLVFTGDDTTQLRPLAPLSSRTYLVRDPSDIYIDVENDGEGVAFDLYVGQ